MRYLYSVVRFVPDPVRGEFINVGAIAGNERARDWEIRAITNLSRARRIDEMQVLPGVVGLLERLGRQIDDFEVDAGAADGAVSEAWLYRLWRESNNIVQFTEPAPIIADSASDALEAVFQEFMIDPASKPLLYKRRNAALRRIRTVYESVGIARDKAFVERAVVEGKNHREQFDFVVANGKAVQLTQAWSFQVPDQKELAENIKAWAWTVRDIRKSGGYVHFNASTIVDVPNTVDIAAVCIPPAEPREKKALDEARAAFGDKDVMVHLVQIDDVQRVAETARDLLVGAGAALY